MASDTSLSPLTLPLRLKRRLHLLNARFNQFLGFLAVIVLLLPIVLVAILLVVGAQSLPEGTIGELLAMVKSELASEPALLIGLAVAPVLAVVIWLQLRHERLVVSDQGIEYRSPFRGPLGFLHGLYPDWRLAWSEIESIALSEGGTRPQQLPWWRLIFKARGGKDRRIAPYNWYRLPDDAGLGIAELGTADAKRCRRAVRESPLYRVLEERALLDLEGEVPAAASTQYDLSSHKGLWALVIGFFVLGGYAVADTAFLTPWRYLEWPAPDYFFLTAVVAAVVAWLVSRGAPKLERWAVVGLFAGAAAGAVYPALLRINAATDRDGVSAYRYRQVEVGRFEPVDRPDIPRLEFNRGVEYWESLEHGGELEFRLARGALKFWQLDLSEVRAEQRAFYRARHPADDEG